MHENNGPISLELTLQKCALAKHGFAHLEFKPWSITGDTLLYPEAVALMAKDAEVLMGFDVEEAFKSHCRGMIDPLFKQNANLIPVSRLEGDTSNWRTTVCTREVMYVLWGTFFCKQERRERLLEVHSTCVST